MHNELRVIDQLTASLLQLVHERILLVGVERLVEAAQFEHGLAPRDEVAQDEFLLARRPHLAHRRISRPARAKRQPARQHQREDLFDRRRLRRAQVRPANHLHLGVIEMSHRAAQVARFGRRVVIEKVNEIATGRLERGIALCGGLLAARHNDLQLSAG